MSFDHLPLDYVHKITTALNNKSRPLIKLDLSATNLQLLSDDNLKTYLNSSPDITLVRCKLNDTQLRFICQIINTTRIQLDLSYANLKQIPSAILKEGLGRIRDITITKHSILKTQVEALIDYHMQRHQECKFNLENRYPHFYFSSDQLMQPHNQVISKYLDITLDELYVQIPYNSKHNIICSQYIHKIECRNPLNKQDDQACFIGLV